MYEKYVNCYKMLQETFLKAKIKETYYDHGLEHTIKWMLISTGAENGREEQSYFRLSRQE